MAIGCECMIDKEELMRIKTLKNVPMYYLEKEYLQHILLNSLSRNTDNLVFKGGTCLRIVYEFPRASEDLDFNTALSIKEIKVVLNKCLKDFSLLGIDYTIYCEKSFEGNYRTEIRFKGPLYNNDIRTSNVLKIDFNKSKTHSTETVVIKKLFADVPPFTLRIMGKQELLAEKLRALMMRAQPRDLYDVWMLFGIGISVDKKLLSIKLKEDGISEFKFRVPSEKSYLADLKILMHSVPDYDQVVNDVKKKLNL
jgi:predicted nucleotidyltransferase component of viral defense system